MDTSTFEKLLEHSENSILDFKREMYDFDNDSDDKKIAKYLKDIISFSNTVRTETSYIIIGIHKNDEGIIEYLGINKNIDEAILQAKAKDKIFPIPLFNYYTIRYNEKLYGIFEFPIVKYPTFLSASVNLKSLRAGMPYYRKGSSNEEAFGNISTHITDWLRNLPNIQNQITIEKDSAELISTILFKACNTDVKLTETLTEALSIARKFNIERLVKFCTDQLLGVPKENQQDAENYKYRIQKTPFCVNRIQNVSANVSQSQIIQHLRDTKNYWEYNLFFADSISSIESTINKIGKIDGLMTLVSSLKKIKPDLDIKDYEITFLIFHSSYVKLYNAIRQEFIEILVSI